MGVGWWVVEGKGTRRTCRSPPLPAISRVSRWRVRWEFAAPRRPQVGPGAVASRPHDLRSGDGQVFSAFFFASILIGNDVS